jgi:hypothetical protein
LSIAQVLAARRDITASVTIKSISQLQEKLDALLEQDPSSITLTIRSQQAVILADAGLVIDAETTAISLIFQPSIGDGQVPVVCQESEDGAFVAFEVT